MFGRKKPARVLTMTGSPLGPADLRNSLPQAPLGLPGGG